MQVRAIARGYYNHRLREEGVEFSIKKKEDFSEKWMEKADGPRKGRKKDDDGEGLYTEELEQAAARVLTGKDSSEEVI